MHHQNLYIKILRNFFKIRPRVIHAYSDGSGSSNPGYIGRTENGFKTSWTKVIVKIPTCHINKKIFGWFCILDVIRSRVVPDHSLFTSASKKFVYFATKTLIICLDRRFFSCKILDLYVFWLCTYCVEKINNFHECALYFIHGHIKDICALIWGNLEILNLMT